MEPRERLHRRLAGELGTIYVGLRAPSATTTPAALLLLQLTSLLEADPDAALEAGYRGIHPLLVSLASDEDEEVADAAAAAIAATVDALPQGVGFPQHKAATLDILLPPPPSQLSIGSFLRCDAVDADALRPWLSEGTLASSSVLDDSAALCAELTVLARSIPSTVRRQRGQSDVGNVLWPAAPVLARWLAAHRGLLPHSKMLEVGAGMGLTGLAAGLVAAAAEASCDVTHAAPASVTLSDYNPFVLANLRYNAVLNDPSLNRSSFPRLFGDSGHTGAARFHVAKLDWSRLDSPDEDAVPSMSGEFDVVIGSDMICCDADAHGVVQTLRRYLRRPAACPSVGAATPLAGAAAAPSHLPTVATRATLWSSESTASLPSLADSDRGPSVPPVMTSSSPACFGAPPAQQDSPHAFGSDLPRTDSALAERSNRFDAVGGVAVFLLPQTFTRYGVDKLESELARGGFVWERRPINPLFLSARCSGEGEAEEGECASSDADSCPVTAGGNEAMLQLWVVRWPTL